MESAPTKSGRSGVSRRDSYVTILLSSTIKLVNHTGFFYTILKVMVESAPTKSGRSGVSRRDSFGTILLSSTSKLVNLTGFFIARKYRFSASGKAWIFILPGFAIFQNIRCRLIYSFQFLPDSFQTTIDYRYPGLIFLFNHL